MKFFDAIFSIFTSFLMTNTVFTIYEKLGVAFAIPALIFMAAAFCVFFLKDYFFEWLRSERGVSVWINFFFMGQGCYKILLLPTESQVLNAAFFILFALTAFQLYCGIALYNKETVPELPTN